MNIILETKNSTYFIEPNSNETAMMSGGKLKHPIEIEFDNSFIGKDEPFTCRLTTNKYVNGSNAGINFKTSAIKNIYYNSAEVECNLDDIEL